MKRILLPLLLALLLLQPHYVMADSKWKKVSNTDTALSSEYQKSVAFTINDQDLKAQLARVNDQPQIIELPLADGTTMLFRVSPAPLLPPELAARYPHISVYNGIALNDPDVSAKIDIGEYGFHAAVYNGSDISFTDPASNGTAGLYIVHFKRNEWHEFSINRQCAVLHDAHPEKVNEKNKNSANKLVNGYQLRTYLLALACNHQYAIAATGTNNPTIAQTLSKMVTTMNRINGVYERELAVSMTLVANEDTLIWTSETGSKNGPDPFSAINDDANPCLRMNQLVCDERIGNANYHVGHLFTTGAGGLSQIGVICQAYLKAQSVTGQPEPTGDGFDIDFVSHEMGHEFGANHTFNNGIDGSCSGNNIYPGAAFEPGSGSTIMAYAGICKPDNLQPHSDPYFHAASLIEIQNFITGSGNVCAVKSNTNNKPVGLPSFASNYTIPFLTPFELNAPSAIDSVADTLITYCWEQWNIGDTGKQFVKTHLRGPIFKSVNPTKSTNRVFPNMTMVLADSLSNAGTNNAQGEKVPDAARYLTFKLTARSVLHGLGCILVPDDTIHLDVINSGKGFAVTSQNIPGNVYIGNNLLNVTWNVVNTNTAPVSCDSVGIYLSDDGGYNWPFSLGNFPNNGSAVVTIPNTDTTITRSRIKVKGTGNVFFNVNKHNFTILHSTAPFSNIQVFPSPVHHTLSIYTGTADEIKYAAFDVLGREVSKGSVYGELDIPVHYWARGIYILRFVDDQNRKTIKKFVVE